VDAIYDYIFHFTIYERLIVLLELLLIGFVVYWAVSFLEGTRGERLFRGVVFIVVVGSLTFKLLVYKLQLERVAYLYKGFAFVALLIVAIAFQPEIRRALMSIGQAGFISGGRQHLSRAVEEIISAVTSMAATKTGAIIVIPQEVQLGEFIETGVKIDGKVTSELLQTIFYPGTPLHDLAVVIEGDRVVAAHVQLPLSEYVPRVRGRQLGARHRAALGITSSSDAIVIVVSEETGIISLARDGELISNISEDELRKHLTTAVIESSQSKIEDKAAGGVQPAEKTETTAKR